MFCRQCGKPIGNQAFCSACGAATGLESDASPGPTIPMPTAMPPAFLAGRVRRHLHTLGILWIAFAAYSIVTWLVAYTFLRGYFGGHAWFMSMGAPWMYGMHGAPTMPGVALWWMPMVTVFVTLRGLLSIATGIALLTRQAWGRTFAIVVAILTVLKPITGTVLAIYTLWVLWGPFSSVEYAQIAAEGTEEL